MYQCSFLSAFVFIYRLCTTKQALMGQICLLARLTKFWMITTVASRCFFTSLSKPSMLAIRIIRSKHRKNISTDSAISATRNEERLQVLSREYSLSSSLLHELYVEAFMALLDFVHVLTHFFPPFPSHLPFQLSWYHSVNCRALLFKILLFYSLVTLLS